MIHLTTHHHVAPVASAHGVWGTYESSAGRYGLMQERLVVLPPGSRSRDRRIWTLMRIWPPVGFLLGILLAVAGAQRESALVGAIAGLIVWLAPLVWMWRRTRGFSARIHEEWTHRSAASEAAEGRLRTLGRALADSERRAAAGLISRDDFAALWADIYDAVGAETASAPPAVEPRSAELRPVDDGWREYLENGTRTHALTRGAVRRAGHMRA